MNILILSWRDINHPLAGGAEKVTNEHAKAWVKEGHSVTLFTSYFPGAKEFELNEGIKTIRTGYELLGVQIRCFFWYLFSKHPKYDLVVDHFHGLPFFSPFYIRTRKIAVIQEVAKKVWLLNHLKRPLNWIIGLLGLVIEPITFIPYKRIPFVTGSESVKKDLINFGIAAQNITVIQHGVSVILPKIIPIKEKKRTVIYLGALTRDKGIEDAIKIFALLKQKNSDYQFWVVGRSQGGYFEYIKLLARKIGLKDNLKFWGFVSEEKKFELLIRSHVLIHPSATEGWGLNVIESSAVGTPVVGYNVSGLKDSIKQGINGFLVPDGNLIIMAEMIDKLITDGYLYSKVKTSAIKYGKYYTWGKSKNLFINYINKITQKRILMLNWKDIKHPDSGGAEIVSLKYLSSWAKDGYDVTWFSSSYKGSKTEEIIEEVKIVRQGNQIFGVHLYAILFYLKTGPYDLVVDQFHGIPFFTPLFVRTKKISFIHEVAREVWRLNPWPVPFNLIPWIFGDLFEPLIFQLLYTNTPFLTVSESTRKDLMKWGIKPNRISLIENGVTVIKIKNQTRLKKTALYLGAIARDKGIEDAIRVFNIIHQKDQSWQFWIVGKGIKNYVSKLKEMSIKYKIDAKLKFFGYVSDPKKFELLSKASILLNPSVREGWGLVNIEANSVGTPVIGYNVAGVKDSVIDGKTGLLAQLGDYRSLAELALKLSSDEKYYNKISKNSLEWSKKFTWQKSAEKSLKLVKNLLSQ